MSSSGHSPSSSLESVASEFFSWASNQRVAGLAKLFHQLLPLSLSSGCSADVEKDRSEAVPCLERTRVKLLKDNEEDGEYIHANWVKIPRHERIYIATQAPLENTIEDFWRMVWQQQVRLVVNLVGCCEEGRIRYWPEEGTQKFGRFSVTMKKMIIRKKSAVFILEIVPDGWECNGLLVHLVNPWNVSNGPLEMLRAFQSVYSVDLLVNPLVIHCSTGVGRTGAFILADSLIFRLFTGKSINVEELFRELVSQRAMAIVEEKEFVSAVLVAVAYIAHRHPGYEEDWKELEQEFFERYKIEE